MPRSTVPFDAMELVLLARARHQLETALGSQVPDAVKHGMIVRGGRATDVLLAAVAECDAPMLVLGGKHHSTLGRWLGGSTAQHVVRRLHVPLLITAGEWHARPRIMVAVDASYAGRPTIEQATAFARLLGGPLHALHAVEPSTTHTGDSEGWSRERMERDIWPLLPVPDHHRVIRRGEPVETIVQEAAAWRADVIVVGSHGKDWVDRLLIGSVTEQLLSNLPAAILVIPVPPPVRHAPAAIGVQAAAAWS
jgi:nucleotide-binding universal stress UspA family protein